MKRTRIHCAAGLITAALVTSPAIAQTVEMVPKDGSTTVKGILVSVQDNKFVVRTNIGVVTFDRDSVSCLGAACPVTLPEARDLTVAAPAELANIILPLLADGYAESLEGEARLLSAEGVPLDGQASSESLVRSRQAGIASAYNIQLSGPNDEATAVFSVRTAGRDGLFDLLSAGEVSLILSETPADDEAVNETRAAGGGDLRDSSQERVLAVDGYVVVTHARNQVRSLSIAQISDVISGKIDNWSAFGGPDHSIHVYSFKPDAEAFHHISDLILQPRGLNLTPEARFIQSNRELTVAIENDRFGFGIVNYSSVRDTQPIAIENECGMVIAPTSFNIKTEEYTLQNRITVYNRRDKEPVVASFLEFLDNPNIDNLVAKAGLISLSIIGEREEESRARLLAAVASATPEVSSTLLQRFVLDVMNTTRLSTTFRFSPGSARLDNKALNDLERVLRYVEDHRPRRLILAGYTDANGGFRQNLSLSQSRARSVLDALRAADRERRLKDLEIEVRGYGELGPVACNELPAGRATNRRVEIWAE